MTNEVDSSAGLHLTMWSSRRDLNSVFVSKFPLTPDSAASTNVNLRIELPLKRFIKWLTLNSFPEYEIVTSCRFGSAPMEENRAAD